MLFFFIYIYEPNRTFIKYMHIYEKNNIMFIRVIYMCIEKKTIYLACQSHSVVNSSSSYSFLLLISLIIIAHRAKYLINCQIYSPKNSHISFTNLDIFYISSHIHLEKNFYKVSSLIHTNNKKC
jgi:hypothetical protein